MLATKTNRIIAMKLTGALRINNFIKAHPASRTALNLWTKVVREVDWQSHDHITNTFRNVESLDGAWLFPLEAGQYRIAAAVWFPTEDRMGKWVRVLQVMDGAETFDCKGWKADDAQFKRLGKAPPTPLARGDRLAAGDPFLDAHYARVASDSNLQYTTYSQSLTAEQVEDMEYPFPTDKTTPEERLQFLLRENDLVAADIAALLEVSAEDVNAIMQGNRAPTEHEVKTLGARFSVHPTFFGSMNTY